MMAIMLQLGIKGVRKWNDMNIDERDGMSGKIKTEKSNAESETLWNEYG